VDKTSQKKAKRIQKRTVRHNKARRYRTGMEGKIGEGTA
jgi:hypothetical protein